MNDQDSPQDDEAPESGETETKTRIVTPPNFLKSKIKIAPGLLEEALARAEKLIANLQGEFVASTEIRINKLVDIYKQWTIAGSREAAVREFRRLAHDLKGEAGTFGYDLITQIGDLFGDYLRETPVAQQKPEVVKSYIDTFQIVWSQRITGTGGDAGQQLIASLIKLNEKSHSA